MRVVDIKANKFCIFVDLLNDPSHILWFCEACCLDLYLLVLVVNVSNDVVNYYSFPKSRWADEHNQTFAIIDSSADLITCCCLIAQQHCFCPIHSRRKWM